MRLMKIFKDRAITKTIKKGINMSSISTAVSNYGADSAAKSVTESNHKNFSEQDKAIAEAASKCLDDFMIKPYIQTAGHTPPPFKNFTNMKPHLVLSWNILGAYGGDIPVCETRVMEALEKFKNNPESLRVLKKYIQPLPLFQIKGLPKLFLELQIVRNVLAKLNNMNKASLIAESIKQAVEETKKEVSNSCPKYVLGIESQIKEETILNNTDYLPLLKQFGDSLTDFFVLFWATELGKSAEAIQQDLLKRAGADFARFIRDLKAKLPENKELRDEGLWCNRGEFVKKVLSDKIKEARSLNIPAVVIMQEPNVDQFNDLRKTFPDCKWVSYSNSTGTKTEEIPFDKKSNKFTDGHGFNNTIMFTPGWEIEEVKIEWLSPTPTQPSKTEGGSHIPRTILGVRVKNLQTGKVECYFNTHCDFPMGTQAITAARINAFVKNFTQNGKWPHYIGTDLNTYRDDPNGALSYKLFISGRQDYRVPTSKEFIGFFAPEQIAKSTFGGKPEDPFKNKFDSKGNFLPNSLDHLAVSNDVNVVYSFRDPAVYDSASKEMVAFDDPKFAKAILERHYASDHFMNGLLAIDGEPAKAVAQAKEPVK